MEEILEKRKLCIPLNKLKIEFNKEKQNDEKYLKQYVSIFDLNPYANNLVFETIPEYKNRYLNKYKFTLFYNDAKNLGCFKEVNEIDLINSINSKLDELLFKEKHIQKIEILSKAKLIDFLLYLELLESTEDTFEEDMKYINSLRLGIDLIFKAPINLGNNELKYYFYYELFINFFSDNKNEINTLDYFPIVNINSFDYINVDMTEFYERKQKLFNFIKENNNNKGDRKDNKESPDKKISKKEMKYQLFEYKLDYFKNFQDAIIKIFFDGKKDEEIIENLKYLYYYIILTIKPTKFNNISFKNIINMKNDTFDYKRMKNIMRK